MKRIWAVVIMLCLLCGCALAAPVRDEREQALSGDELQDIRELADCYVYAALLKGERALAHGQTPSQDYLEGVLVRVLQRRLLDNDKARADSVTLDGSAFRVLYAQLFAGGEAVVPAQPHCPCVKAVGDGLEINIVGEDADYVGLHIYRSIERDGYVTAYGDVYLQSGFDCPPVETPEEALSWVCGAILTLKRDENAPFGFTLDAYTLGDEYAVGEWQLYTDENLGFEILLPDLLASGARRTADGLEAVSDDGAISLRVRCEQNAYADGDALIAAYPALMPTLTDENSGMTVLEGAGTYMVCYRAEGMLYSFTMTYPAARADECTLYAEYLRNSFVVEAIAVG